MVLVSTMWRPLDVNARSSSIFTDLWPTLCSPAHLLTGHTPIHKAITIMLNERSYYEGEFGTLRYQEDVWVQERIDPMEEVRQ
jgi:hypothetical protein